ncbi:hypothetical protein CI610_01661 [invertebrate metagenome]|uniref:Uncharacterized protein n=1 Tax=invertebrate metagenome TaxID=1711999 RepID=A0A2H9T809_9ZZZZ
MVSGLDKERGVVLTRVANLLLERVRAFPCCFLF